MTKSLLRKKTFQTQRSSVLLKLRATEKWNLPLDEQVVWDEIQKAFKDHPFLAFTQCEIRPDKDGTTIDQTSELP